MSSRKKKTKTQSSEVFPILSLPHDLLLSCIARLSRLYYPTLSLVSKSFRSLVASPELYNARSIINHTESCLYVCIEFPPDEPNQRWFTLCRKPNQTQTNKKKKKKSSGYVLVPVPVLNSPPVHRDGLVAFGSDIYAIGGSSRNEYSSSVSVLDCKSHKWYEAPRMRIERNYATANVVDGRIYVSGGSQDHNDSNKMEVFDTNTQTWDLVVSPPADRLRSSLVAVGSNIYSICGFIGMYASNARQFQWYDSVVRHWNELKGLKGLPKIGSYSTVKLVACGGKLVVLWDKNVPASGYKEKMIWCAEISLENRNSEEIWGKVEWAGAVLTVPKSYNFVSALVATV